MYCGNGVVSESVVGNVFGIPFVFRSDSCGGVTERKDVQGPEIRGKIKNRRQFSHTVFLGINPAPHAVSLEEFCHVSATASAERGY